MYKAVIFDFGGTLDTNGIHWSVKFLETYRKFGLKFTEEEFNNAYVETDKELKCISGSIFDYRTLLLGQTQFHLNFLKPEGYKKAELGKLALSITNEIMSDVEICLAESKKIFQTLKKNYKLGIASNFYGNLERICDNIGFTKYTDVLIDSEKEGIEKPHPGIFSLALQKLDVIPGNTYVVGDSYERDIIPSKILGCNTIWLRKKGLRECDSTDSADYIVKDLGDILRYLT